MDEVKNPEGEVLLRKWQQEYFDEKDAESKEKSKARQEKKKQNKQAKEDLEGGKEAGDGAPSMTTWTTHYFSLLDLQFLFLAAWFAISSRIIIFLKTDGTISNQKWCSAWGR